MSVFNFKYAQASNNLSPKDGTPLWPAVNLALDQLGEIDNNCYKVIVVLSDGMDTTTTLIDEYLIEKVKEMQIPIFTLCYGETREVNPQVLAMLSAYSGAGGEQVGSFAGIHPKDWAMKLDGIGHGLINIYEIRWKSTGAPSKTHVEVVCKVACEINKIPYETEILQSYVSP